MRLEKKGTTNLYSKIIKQQEGGGRFNHPVFRPYALRNRRRGGFSFKPFLSVAKNVLKDVGPDLGKMVVKTGMDVLSGKKNLKQAIKDNVNENKGKILKKAGQSLKKQIKGKLKGEKKQTGGKWTRGNTLRLNKSNFKTLKGTRKTVLD